MSLNNISLFIVSISVICLGISFLIKLRIDSKRYKNIQSELFKLKGDSILSNKNKPRYKKYKALEDLGVKPEEQYTNWVNDVNSCGREQYWKEQEEIYGIDERETWNWSDDFMDYVYIHLEMFERINIVDFDNDYETIVFDGEKMTIQQAMDYILNWYRTKYYPDKLDTINIDNYPMTDEGRAKWQQDTMSWNDEKHRVIRLFAEIIEHLNW